MKHLIAANWKMNGDFSWTSKPKQLRDIVGNSPNIDILLCPPAHLLKAMNDACMGLDIAIGAQNCHDKTSGAFTGEISAKMVKDCGADYVILGHSERRAMFGDNDDWVARKTIAAQAVGLIPIICVGETEEVRQAGQAEEIVGQQIAASLEGEINGGKLVVAYEPVWAIGTGLVPSLEDIATMHDHIRGCLVARFGEQIAIAIKILYGGSVKPENAKDILALQDVNGALIGGAGLEMQSLAAIAKSAP